MVLLNTLLFFLVATTALAAPLSRTQPSKDHTIVSLDEDVERTPTREQIVSNLGVDVPPLVPTKKISTRPSAKGGSSDRKHTTRSLHRRSIDSHTVRAARIAKGLSQAALAAQANLPRATITAIENGSMAITRSVTSVLSRILGIR